MRFLLDSSVALAWCFEDERTPATTALLHRAAETGAAAPQHWPRETPNGLMTAERSKRVDASRRKTLSKFLHDLPITLDPETVTRIWTTTQLLAERFRHEAEARHAINACVDRPGMQTGGGRAARIAVGTNVMSATHGSYVAQDTTPQEAMQRQHGSVRGRGGNSLTSGVGLEVVIGSAG